MGRITFQESAGGVLVEEGRVLLIRTRTRSGRSVWTFPKGRIQRGEPSWAAALREVREETGYLCRLKRRLKATSYVFRGDRAQVRKTVHWFLVEPVRKAGMPNPHEVQEAGWFSLPEAYAKLSYRTDLGLLRAAEDTLRNAKKP